MHMDFPFHIGPNGHTALTDEADHARDLLEQLLFTSPGERVNRPLFGCGLSRILFDPLDPALASTLPLAIEVAIQTHLADEVRAGAVRVHVKESELHVEIEYIALRDPRNQRTARFTRRSA